MFAELLEKITSTASMGFGASTDLLIEYVNSTEGFMDILEQIGTIPESITHDSTEEKLFSKASDAVLARAFREIGLKSTVIRERSDSADVLVESPAFSYTMVADAKAFRMSRTAKNQKDFKVVALSGWRKDADYAVLCAPYFHYPNAQSQIYSQSVEHNVCLLSWEHLVFLVKNEVKESARLNFADIWNFGEYYSHKVLVADRKRCFLSPFTDKLISITGCDPNDFSGVLDGHIAAMRGRGETEKEYWKNERARISSYTRRQAVDELIKAKKIEEKISRIEQFMKGLPNG